MRPILNLKKLRMLLLRLNKLIRKLTKQKMKKKLQRRRKRKQLKPRRILKIN